MKKTALSHAAALNPKKPVAFNFNKLQAVLCIASSAVVSIGLIVWFVKAFA